MAWTASRLMRFRRAETKKARQSGPAVSCLSGRSGVDGVAAGVVEENDALFPALAADEQAVPADVCVIQPHKLGNPQPAVKKQAQYTVVAFLIIPIHRGEQQPFRFLERKIAGEGLELFRRVEVRDGVVRELFRLDGVVFIEAPERRNLPRAARCVQAVLRRAALFVPDLVAGEEGEVVVNLAGRDGARKLEVDVVDGDVLELGAARDYSALYLDKAEKVAQVEEILVDRRARMPLIVS